MARMKSDFGLRDLVLLGTIMVSIAVFVTKIDAMTNSLQAVVDDHQCADERILILWRGLKKMLN